MHALNSVIIMVTSAGRYTNTTPPLANTSGDSQIEFEKQIRFACRLTTVQDIVLCVEDLNVCVCV